MKQDEKQKARLAHWKPIVARDESVWQKQKDKMEWREKLYEGTHELQPVTGSEEKGKGPAECWHVRNIIAENIESMVDSRIPKPKVIAMHKEDEKLARILEHMLLFWAKRHHLRVMNDLAERMVPIQGGCAYLLEWDSKAKNGDELGDVSITLLHPKQLVPQGGIYTTVADMDHVAVKLGMTRQQVRMKFGKDLTVSEEDPQIREKDEDAATALDLITVYVLYYRNEDGGVGLLAWAGDEVLADLEDYQGRRLRRCRSCGALDSEIEPPEPAQQQELETAGVRKPGPKRCRWCEGTSFETVTVDAEEVMKPRTILTNRGEEIRLKPPTVWLGPDGELQRFEINSTIPYYKPDLMPVILQKNISRFGQLLGESDADKMADQQNTLKRLDKKILDRILKAGTRISLPGDVMLDTDGNDSEVFRVERADQLNMIRTYEFTGDISPETSLSQRIYEESRQIAGITDSMQGRRDTTATSAKAKEFAAAKSEGRMESRRVMKQEAWARIYETVAKLMLANADGPRRIRVETEIGKVEYETFDREMFLQQDQDGTIYYAEGFIFETDDATSLGESREAMWKEITSSFQAGTLGDPAQLGTLAMYWGLMEEQCYPGAGQIKKKIEEQMERMQAAPAPTPVRADGGGEVPPEAQDPAAEQAALAMAQEQAAAAGRYL